MCFGPGHVSMPYASIAEWLVSAARRISCPGFVCEERYFEKPYKDQLMQP